MKIKTLTASLLAMFMLAACSKSESAGPGPDIDKADVAYLSIKVKKQGQTRASVGNDGDINESALHSIYAFTFNSAGVVMKVPGTNDFYTEILGSSTTPGAFKISGSSKSLLIVANPGSNLRSMFGTIGASSTFTTINAAIQNSTLTEITDSAPFNKGFAMINSGNDSGLSAGQKITDPLIDISNDIKYVGGSNATEADAIADANSNRVDVTIERLASKLALSKKAGGITVEPVADGAEFELLNWTVDAVNSTFYPFAEKTILAVDYTGNYYNKNFYTKDPNFTGKSGIRYTTVDRTGDYSPQLVAPYGWMDDGDEAYCIENTMAAADQTFQNATRLVIKGAYYPASGWSGDWFHFAGTDYKDLATLKAKYVELGPGNLQNACDAMFDKLDYYVTNNNPGLTWTATDFLSLDQAELDEIPNGGEIIKDGINPVIRWYQKGLCYYYYQIRHDDETTEVMAFGKYGVVRNNWYSLSLAKVHGAGTPWYPDIDNPGPGDPDPTDPIDEKTGYLGIEVKVAPWIFWERDIEI